MKTKICIYALILLTNCQYVTFGKSVDVESVEVNTITSNKDANTGRGFYVTSEGYILTANHVIKDSYIVTIRPEGTTDNIFAKIVYQDDLYDIAVLKTDLLFGKPVDFCNYSLIGKKYKSRNNDLILVTNDDIELKLIGLANFGDSGSPVIDEEYQCVIGMTIRINKNSNYTIALSHKKIKEVLGAVGLEFDF